MKDDMRPPFVLDDVKDGEFNFIQADRGNGIPTFKLNKVEGLKIFKCKSVQDTTINHADSSAL